MLWWHSDQPRTESCLENPDTWSCCSLQTLVKKQKPCVKISPLPQAWGPPCLLPPPSNKVFRTIKAPFKKSTPLSSNPRQHQSPAPLSCRPAEWKVVSPSHKRSNKEHSENQFMKQKTILLRSYPHDVSGRWCRLRAKEAIKSIQKINSWSRRLLLWSCLHCPLFYNRLC